MEKEKNKTLFGEQKEEILEKHEREIPKIELVRNEMTKIKEFMMKNGVSDENIFVVKNMIRPVAEFFFKKFLNEFKFNNFQSNIKFNMDNHWEDIAVEIDFCKDRMTYERLSNILIKINNIESDVNGFKLTGKIEKGDTRSASGDMI